MAQTLFSPERQAAFLQGPHPWSLSDLGPEGSACVWDGVQACLVKEEKYAGGQSGARKADFPAAAGEEAPKCSSGST